MHEGYGSRFACLDKPRADVMIDESANSYPA